MDGARGACRYGCHGMLFANRKFTCSTALHSKTVFSDGGIMFVFIPVTAAIFPRSLRDKIGIDARSVKWGRVSRFERSIINFLLDIVMFVLAL